MKRSGIALILIVFLVCMVTGFLLTKVLKPQTLTTAQVEPKTSQQQNIVLIHLNNFVSDAPRVQSIWIIFLRYGSRPSMGFLPMYQDGQPNATLPGGSITLTPEKHLPESYLETLASAYKVRLDGYVLLDDQAMITFANLFPATPQTQAVTFPSSEHEILARICSHLTTIQPGKVIEVPWMEVLPHNFSTDVPFDTFLENWGKLTDPANPPTCEIITRQN